MQIGGRLWHRVEVQRRGDLGVLQKLVAGVGGMMS